MKDFDIEKLKRENIFKTPDGFFEDMQKKVLQETLPVKKGNIINLRWAYSAAAAIALLVGVSTFINFDPAVDPELVAKTAPVQIDGSIYTLSDNKPIKEEAVALKVLEEDLTLVANTNQKINAEQSTNLEQNNASPKSTTRFANKTDQKTTQNPEIQVDQILASFTSAELADVGKNTEQDIYLDLYN